MSFHKKGVNQKERLPNFRKICQGCGQNQGQAPQSPEIKDNKKDCANGKKALLANTKVKKALDEGKSSVLVEQFSL